MWRFGAVLCLLVIGCNSARSPEQPPQPASESPAVDLQRFERLIHRGINEFRIGEGLGALAWDGELHDIAEAHSHNMAQEDYFSHVSPSGATPSDRAGEADYECRKHFEGRIYTGIGENIYYTSQYESYRITRRGAEQSVQYDWKSLRELADEVVTGWINSPDHRRNILTRRYTREGIGAFLRDDYRIYVTQNFC